jgi:hypothetical protein
VDTFGLMGLFYLPFMAAAFAVWLVVGFFFLLNLRDLLTQVSPQNRAMRPDQVWLNLIPLFNLAWIFVTVVKVRDSVGAEFRSRGWAPKGDFSLGLGIAAAILTILGWGPFGLAALVCWIVYWIRMSELKNQLITYRGYSPGASQPPRVSGESAEPGSKASYCPSCGAAHSPGASFCRSCGRPAG